MVEISDKESIIKYINSKRDKENEYFFDGTNLLMQDHIYYSSLKNFIVTLTDFEIGAIRVGTPTIKETFEIINFIKGKVIENGFVKISINQNNKKLNSIIKRLKKQLTNCINYCDLEYEYLLIYKDKIIRNILSIDIDVLFDDMNIFQKYIDDTLTPRQSWQVVKWKSERDGLNLNYNPNYKVYKKILDIIKGKCINSLVFKIEEHDEIINVMKNNNCHYSDLYNIDFHQDINYGNDDSELNIENWVKYAKEREMIYNYNWINRIFSVESNYPFKIGKKSILDTTVEELPNFDLVVICKSKHFTPPKCWDIQNKLYNYTKEV